MPRQPAETHDLAMADTLLERQLLREYREAYERANSARIGSPAFRAAMAEVQRLSRELVAAGVARATWLGGNNRRRR